MSDIATKVGSIEVSNRLLRAVPPQDLRLLLPHLESVSFGPDASSDLFTSAVMFIESGAIALAPAEGKVTCAILGNARAVGVLSALGADLEPLQPVPVTRGTGLRIAVSDLRRAMDDIPSIRAVFVHEAASVLAQVAKVAVDASCRSVQTRVAAWLLAVSECIGDGNLMITHHAMAGFLNVRRAGVTDSLHILEEHHAIVSKRGQIVIRDIDKLRWLAVN